jgi:hypothetical protein
MEALAGARHARQGVSKVARHDQVFDLVKSGPAAIARGTAHRRSTGLHHSARAISSSPLGDDPAVTERVTDSPGPIALELIGQGEDLLGAGFEGPCKDCVGVGDLQVEDD